MTPKIKEWFLDLLGRLSIIGWCYKHHCRKTPQGFYEEYSSCKRCDELGDSFY
jgi:hypothetical protein